MLKTIDVYICDFCTLRQEVPHGDFTVNMNDLYIKAIKKKGLVITSATICDDCLVELHKHIEDKKAKCP